VWRRRAAGNIAEAGGESTPTDRGTLMRGGGEAQFDVWVGQRWASHAAPDDLVRIVLVDRALDVVEVESDSGVITCGPIAELLATHSRLDQD
jgi:hypothetical protein